MTMDPTQAWVITHNGKIVHVRTTKGLAEACATIEKDLYGPSVEVKVVPVLMTEITDAKE